MSIGRSPDNAKYQISTGKWKMDWSSPARFARGLLRDSQIYLLLTGESLKDGMERVAVARTDHGRGVGRLNHIRVAVADNHFGYHQVDHLIQQPSFENPERYLQTRGRRRGARFEVNEADAAAIFLEFFQNALLFAVGAATGADEHRCAPAPGQFRIDQPGVV